jgi:hypothetical protein
MESITESEITYYVIPRDTMDDIIYYSSPDNNRYLSYEDEKLLEKAISKKTKAIIAVNIL